MWQALATAYDVELPGEGPAGARLSDLPRVAMAANRSASTAELVGALLLSGTLVVGRRFSRWIPVFGVGLSARSASQRARSLGASMARSFARRADADPLWEVEDAIVVA